MKIINFLPAKIKKMANIKYLALKLFKNIALILLPFIIAIFGLEMYYLHKEKQLTQLQQSDYYKNYQLSLDANIELKLMSSEYSQYQEMNVYIDSLPIADIKDLDILSECLPANCYLTSFSSVGKENIILISGRATSRSIVTLYLQKLDNIKRYTNVILKELTNSADSDISFSIELNIAEKKEEK